MSKPKKVALWIGGAIVALFVIAGLASNHDGGKAATAGTSASQAAGSTARNAAVPAGSSVRDGKFEFCLLGVERSKQASDPRGNPFETVTAQGEFVIVTGSVENIGDQARSFSATNQKLVDTSDRQYNANIEADTYMNHDTLSGDINPGNAVQERVAFDVAPGTQVRELILHDGMLSGGAHLVVDER